ncbi:hypothetical protein CSA37_00995 [Candidatus Fermentibacteria bacterium]|nr:MAG: hypothetical protein CSA37_00995 [Candidatus Fermentibacteria bacterium]
MKHLAVFALLLLLLGCGEKPDTDPAINIPEDEIENAAVPDLDAGVDLARQNACRANLQTASTQVIMYISQHEGPPETLDEALSVPISCPEGGSYQYIADRDSWKIQCPAAHSHGYIENGLTSW